MDYSEIIARQREFYFSGITRTYAYRRNSLKKLLTALNEQEDNLLAALGEDLGKNRFEGYVTELAIVKEEIRFLLARLKKWMKPEKVRTPFVHFPSRSKIYAEPLGTVLIMSPWNYPLQLTLAPLADALAAGNCAVVKPSRYSGHTARAIEDLIRSIFPQEYVSVFQGGSEVNTALLNIKYDHIFFTGSPEIGKIVMGKAAEFLTPVTLELGGKSPCIVDQTADIRIAAQRIVWGKFLNAGQTCVAPDTLYVHASVCDALCAEMKKSLVKMYGESPLKSCDFGKIINEKHYLRLAAQLADGEAVAGGEKDDSARRIAPTILKNVREGSPLLTEEIFGPILPVIVFTDLAELTERLKRGKKPLACYLFSQDKKAWRQVITNVPFGGGCVNDTVVHLVNPYLPFGGIGESGMGSYHGRRGFETFSHFKPVLKKGTGIDVRVRYAPYGDRLQSVKRLMK